MEVIVQTKSDKMSNLPRHISIIMDGNGRWASDRGLPRSFGHREGMNRVVDIVEHASKIGVEYLSLYAFSTENWKRPAEEVNALMELLVIYIRNQLNRLHKNGVIINIMGDIDALPNTPKREIIKAVEKTENNKGMTLNLGINYGGRNEIINACKKLYMEIEDNDRSIESIEESDLEKYLYTSSQPDPDLLIRPGAEKRISNFMIYQLAYTEFYFTDILWPDFKAGNLDEAIEEYMRRKRRFGGI
ncbi:MAG: isoprenyl transferase [Tissierellia bacterium]|nr:isoprenyl transferase [Tissierellia bacterium]